MSRHQNNTIKVSIWQRWLLLACLFPMYLPLGGCDTTGGTVAVTTAGVAGATIVGTQIANKSEIEVTVDVYVPGEGELEKDFKLGREIALKRQIEAMRSGDFNSYVVVSKQLQSPMGLLAEHSEKIGTLQRRIADVFGQDTGTPAGKTAASLDTWVKKLDAAIKNYRAFRDTIEELSKTDSVTSKDLEKLNSQLDVLRTSLNESVSVPQSYYGMVLLKFVTANNDGVEVALKIPKDQSASPKYTENDIESIKKIIKAERKLDNGLTERVFELIGSMDEKTPQKDLAIVIAAAIQFELDILTEKKKDLKQGEKAALDQYILRLTTNKDVLDKIWTTLSSDNQDLNLRLTEYGIKLSKLDLSNLLKLASEKERIEYIEGLNAELFFNSTGIALGQTDLTRKVAYRLTYSALLVGVNLGPIINEVMQNVMTSKGIDIITSKDRTGSWQRFAEAKSYGRTGNHDVIIYFENMGKPILKSSAFDPTKFVVANGQTFQRVFFALADVYGLPTGAADGAQADTNLIQLRENRDKANASAAIEKKAYLDSLGGLLNLEDGVFTHTDNTKAIEKLKEAADKLKPKETQATSDGGDS